MKNPHNLRAVEEKVLAPLNTWYPSPPHITISILVNDPLNINKVSRVHHEIDLLKLFVCVTEFSRSLSFCTSRAISFNVVGLAGTSVPFHEARVQIRFNYSTKCVDSVYCFSIYSAFRVVFDTGCSAFTLSSKPRSDLIRHDLTVRFEVSSICRALQCLINQLRLEEKEKLYRSP